jgi:regulator of protease activity HflC (stomatin/prohibitin superfamily)
MGLESAFAWIGQIAEWIGRFFPRREILDTTERAIKYSGFVIPQGIRCLANRWQWMRRVHGFLGHFRITEHAEGIHWYWPYTSRWASHPTARQTDRLETQTMESKDGKTFMVSATITYEVLDLKAFVTTIHSPLTTVIDTAALAVHDVCCDFDWNELQNEQRKGTLKTKLKNEAQKQLTEYGLKVLKLQLNSLARTRVLKISQSMSNEEN